MRGSGSTRLSVAFTLLKFCTRPLAINLNVTQVRMVPPGIREAPADPSQQAAATSMQSVVTVVPDHLDLQMQPPQPAKNGTEHSMRHDKPLVAVQTGPAAPKHPIDELYDSRQTKCCTVNSKSFLIALGIVICLLCGAIVGPVYYTQVVLPRDRARAAAAAGGPCPQAPTTMYVLPPLTRQFVDDFTVINTSSWTYVIGDGSDKGWEFKGWGNEELQV